MIETKHQQKKEDIEKLYSLLEQHPNFFTDHPEALELIHLCDDRGVPSLLEKQIAQLRKKLQQHQEQHQDFIELAKNNEKIETHLAEVCSHLLRFQSVSEFSTELPILLKRIFNIDDVVVKISNTLTKEKSEILPYQACLTRLGTKMAMCDNRWPSSISSLFVQNNIQSAAMIAMKPVNKLDDSNTATKSTTDSAIQGILALGSNDEHRYTHHLGTTHLERLGVMAGTCLARFQLSNK